MDSQLEARALEESQSKGMAKAVLEESARDIIDNKFRFIAIFLIITRLSGSN